MRKTTNDFFNNRNCGRYFFLSVRVASNLISYVKVARLSPPKTNFVRKNDWLAVLVHSKQWLELERNDAVDSLGHP